MKWVKERGWWWEGGREGGSEGERGSERAREGGRGGERRRKGSHSQLAELLAELPGVGPDPADGVVSKVKLLQSQQAVQPALAHLR